MTVEVGSVFSDMGTAFDAASSSCSETLWCRCEKVCVQPAETALSGSILKCLILAVCMAAISRSHADDIASNKSDRRLRLLQISQTLSDEVPLIIATPRATGYPLPHTTEATAFVHALGADFIALTVGLRADGVPVVVTGIPSGSGKKTGLPLPPQRSGRKLSSRARIRVATLADHLRLIQGFNQSRDCNTGVCVRLDPEANEASKDGGTADLARTTLQVLADFGYIDAGDRAFLELSNPAELLRLRTKLKCRLPLLQFCHTLLSEDELAKAARVVDGLTLPMGALVEKDPASSAITVAADVVRTVHRHSLLVHVVMSDVTSDKSDELLNGLVRQGGVDCVLTNHPDLAGQWRREIQQEGGLKGPFHLLRGEANPEP